MSARKRKPQGNPAKLPTWGKYTVPWITRWQGEGPPATLSIGYNFMEDGTRLAISHFSVDGKPLRPVTRCSQGFAWEPCGKRLPGARPEFAQVHVDRQRRAMQELRCQVCSRTLTLAAAHWLLRLAPVADGTVYTEHPAVCVRCLPIATAQCPHIKANEWLLAKADEVECHGVTGCAFDTRDGKIIYDGACSNDATWAGRILAKQSIVRLHVVSCEAVVL